MAEKNARPLGGVDKQTRVERPSDRETLVTRRFDGPARIVFEAWTNPALLKRWWAPASMGVPLLSCEVDARPGGRYRFVFGHEGGESMAFFGRYLEVVPGARLVWTNEESAEGSVTTVTFEEKDGTTLVTVREVFPSKEAFEAAGGAEGGLPEQFMQLDELLVALATGERS